MSFYDNAYGDNSIDRDRDRDRERDRNRGMDGDRGRDGDRERERGRDRDGDRDRERGRDGDRERDRERDGDKGRDKSRDNKHTIPNINTTTLVIKVKTTGDLTTKEYDLIPFHPNMADVINVNKNKNYILFPSFVKITMNDLKNTGGIGTDYQQAFLNLDDYIKVIQYVINPNKTDDPTLIVHKSDIKNYAVSFAQNALSGFLQGTETDMVTIQKYEPLTEEEIITNNIALIMSLFFAPKKRFYILGNEYIIGETKYIPPYVPSLDTNILLENVDSHKHKIPLFYTITVELQLLDAVNNPGVGDFGRMSCKAKKYSIAKDAQEIFGTNFGYVEEKKAPIPSILNTSNVSKDRNFGKLQLEWEERNKYRREPTTERERLEMERNMSPLHKKMAELERKQKELGEVPPLWEKDKKELDDKYKKFDERINVLRQEYKNVTDDNSGNDDASNSFMSELQNGIKDKMYEEVIVLGIEVPADDYGINKLKLDLTGTTSTPSIEPSEIDIIKRGKAKEQDKINDKHVEPFLKKYETIDNDIKSLEEEEKNLKEEITRLSASSVPSDKYNVTALKTKLLKYQADIRKKKSFGLVSPNGQSTSTSGDILTTKKKEIIAKWEKILTDRKVLLKGIDKEKKKGETSIKRDAVEKELKEQFKRITEMNKELLIAYFYENDLVKLTKREIEEYDRERRPDESVKDIWDNLKSLEEEYLETAGKVDEREKGQALLKLCSDYLHRLQKLKDNKKEEKGKIDSKLKDIARTLRDLTPYSSKGSNSNSAVTSGSSQSKSKPEDNKQYDIQKSEERTLLKDFDKIDKELKNIENKDIINVNTIIKEIKTIQGNDKLKSSLKRYQDLKYTVSSTSSSNSSTSTSGGSLNSNIKSKRIHPLIKNRKTKRIMKIKTKNGVTTLRRLKNRIKNKKYTIRRGRD
jgi:hypothetical protein